MQTAGQKFRKGGYMGSKLKSSTTGMNHQQRSAMLRSAIFHMTNNPNFPEPWAGGLSIAIYLSVVRLGFCCSTFVS
jgi:hypothetical protein